MPWDEARCQNLGHLKKCYVAFPLMLIPSNNIVSEMRHPYDLGFLCHEMKVSVTHISWLSDFA